ncbi:unnamed protein product [Rhizoctonia solani]|uniref:Uncharacterized protein n=1 Tax=Rhizoctonia solani TaxID=456999 RepID=A0A8H2X7Y8_9AGAM|nr:unnamed protein product [Rhizoctonia solani]
MSLVFTPDGTRLVSGSEDKTIRIWNVSDGSPVGNPFKGHTQGIRSVVVSPNGTRIASGSNDRTVRVWNIDDGTLVAGPFVGHTARICSVTYSPDGTRVISGSSDHTIRVWNVRDGLLSPTIPFKRHMSHLKSISFFGTGTQILSASEDSSFWVWNIPPCKVASSSPARKRISSLKQPLPTARANTIPEDHTQQILGTADAYPLSGSLKGHKDPLTSSTVSANNAVLVTGFGNGLIRVWDLQKAGLVVDPFHGHGGEVTSLLLSPNHSHVISCSREDTTIRVWDTRNTILRIAPLNSSPTGSTPTHGDSHLLDGWNIREDDWVTNSSSHLLFWIPHDFSSSHVWPSPYAEFIVTKNGVLHIPPQELILGQQWSRCYLPD